MAKKKDNSPSQDLGQSIMAVLNFVWTDVNHIMWSFEKVIPLFIKTDKIIGERYKILNKLKIIEVELKHIEEKYCPPVDPNLVREAEEKRRRYKNYRGWPL